MLHSSDRSALSTLLVLSLVELRSIIWMYKTNEAGTAPHSSVLARRIPWTEELGGVQSMGRKESYTTEAT